MPSRGASVGFGPIVAESHGLGEEAGRGFVQHENIIHYLSKRGGFDLVCGADNYLNEGWCSGADLSIWRYVGSFLLSGAGL